MPAPTVRDPRNKDLGAYYTEQRVARALCRWAMRRAGGRVLDPAFGGGVFLEAAAERAAEIGAWELCGVEIDPAAHSATSCRLGTQAGRDASSNSPPVRLLLTDFFSLSAGRLPGMEAVVGNPPFIRFQRFAGEPRQLAASRAQEAGMELLPLAGSWVAFVAHASSFLRSGGRVAMVLPAELGHSPYARPLLGLLLRKFSCTTFVTFRRSLFPHLDQGTVLLLADGHGDGPGSFAAIELSGPAALDRPLPCSGAIPLDAQAMIEGRIGLAHGLLQPAALELYQRLAFRGASLGPGEASTSSAPAEARVWAGDRPRGDPQGAIRLGEIARVESGYVTGGNSYFHLTPRQALETALPTEALVKAVFRVRALCGLRFAEDDWRAAGEAGLAGYLVQAAGFEHLPAVADFIERLEAAGVHRRYKTRSRRPWYRVGRVTAPPLILAAMGNRHLPMVLNQAAVAVPNTFHTVTPLPRAHGEAGARGLALAWRTSLAALSLELEGHPLGGGLLKLDPGEARNILLPSPVRLSQRSFERLDALLRQGEEERAACEADSLLLRDGLGLSGGEVSLLRQSAEELRSKRQRNRP